ncbi:PREDICTED: vasoactive intestinal polypeptide receptor 2 [Nanorana parkeri]|uniref:vasoactive intestinal polypeptide receptor 2 n=1 Tax=Nanorana parkeri TaxID=125878 RepID=UPI00085482A8|nr:PREDICTED: vasoactive intestinal polypeptide receptor 2 [Nanorana parkeri]
MKTVLSVLLLTFPLLRMVNGFHPECKLQLEIKEEEIKCIDKLQRQRTAGFSRGCLGVWDNVTCWDQAKYGETITKSCPLVLRYYFTKDGNISRNCTTKGWTDVFPNIFDACGHNDNVTQAPKLSFYIIVKAIYTFGHSASLIALTVGSAILCLFRKLHCTRNYIHLNLFLSFILKAISVLVKDDFLYSSSYSCPDSLVGCKIILVFFHYCVTANFYWLLVEGLYLHTLLVVIFSPNRHFTIYLFIGWGIPTICSIVWIVTRIYLEDRGCWDTNEHSIPWWVIRIPIIISIIVNFCLFINIIRILLQKLRSPDVGGNDQSQFKRLTKSTLLLIPLFGVHYMVFTVFQMPSFSECQIWFELSIGSFQGLVVAILYCFLNTEVQGELKRKWGSFYLNRYLSRDYRLQSLSISRNGSECAPQFHRNSRAPSIMQTETSII